MDDLINQKDTFYGELAVTSQEVIYVFNGALLEDKHWLGLDKMINFITDVLERK